MAIQVTCPGCLKRFSVSDKFAGKTGPCPSCKKPIKIPELTEQVVIHAPEESGPKDASGKAVLSPIRRKEVKLSTPTIVSCALAVVVVVALAFGLGLSGDAPPVALLAIGAVILAFPLSFVGYWFLHDDELEAYRGQELLVRCLVVSLAFAGLWLMYAFGPVYVMGYKSMAEMSGMDMVIVVPVMLILGSLIAVAALELEIAQGASLYALYLAATFVLAWLAGTELGGPLSKSGNGANRPTVTQPAKPAEPGDDKPADDAAATDDSKPDVPILLQ